MNIEKAGKKYYKPTSTFNSKTSNNWEDRGPVPNVASMIHD
jgi:hypothetical protein